MSASVSICAIGGGSIGMRHITCAMSSDRVALTAVVEPDDARRADLVNAGLPAVANLEDVPPQTQAAIVATPTASHAHVAMACLDLGWDVLVEKPLTQSQQEAGRLINHAHLLGRVLVTGHHRRCHPFVARAKSMLAQIGAVVAVQGIWSLRKHDSYYEADWRRAAGAGVILTNLSHEVDLLQYLAGPIVEVSAMTSHAARGLDVEDTVSVAMRFENGALGSFVMSDAGASPWAFEAATAENPAIEVRGTDPLRLIGTKGAISCPSLETWVGTDAASTNWQHQMIHQSAPDVPQVDPIAAQLERFAMMVDGQPDDLLATGADGQRTMRVLDAIAQSAQSGTTQQVTP